MPRPFLSHPGPNSSLNSVNSSDSRSSGSLSHSSSPLYRYRSITVPQQVPARLASVSSHDSGFASHDAFQSKSPSPMPSDPTSQVSPLRPHVSPTCFSNVPQLFLSKTYSDVTVDITPSSLLCTNPRSSKVLWLFKASLFYVEPFKSDTKTLLGFEI